MVTTSTIATKDEKTADQERRRAQRVKNQSAIDLLDSWAIATEEEIAEQRETWEFLKKALDEDRLSYRKLFP
jgi:hypothetical protein